MSITQKEADDIELRFIEIEGIENDYSVEIAKKQLSAWNYLLEVMTRENNLSDNLGIESIDWQIGNWANDTTMTLINAKLYEDVIKVNEQILKIKWKSDADLFYENAKRDIADAYASLGNYAKCIELYEKYLNEDPNWGWGYIGYFRQLKTNDKNELMSVMELLYNKIVDNVKFRDNLDLCRELGDEYKELGDLDKANYLYSKEKEFRNRERVDFSSVTNTSNSLAKGKKIYTNAPCPCGSGKKYKKCCGKND